MVFFWRDYGLPLNHRNHSPLIESPLSEVRIVLL